MKLYSSRLVYNALVESDFEDYKSWYGNDQVMRFIAGQGMNDQQLAERFEKALAFNRQQPGIGYIAVRLKENNTFVGMVKFAIEEAGRAEVGYGALPRFWRKGLCSEMLQWQLEIAPNFPEIQELYGIVQSGNIGSIRILENAGFRLAKDRLEEGVLLHEYVKQQAVY